MTVHFIGAGPGAPDLITVRGLTLIRSAPVVLYAGSLVPTEVIAEARADARVCDTAAMTLDEIEAEFIAADAAGKDVARVHSGDPSLYGATAEQMRRLDRLEIPYTITPGVPAYAAAAAALGIELTVPGVAQTVTLTRTTERTSLRRRGAAAPWRSTSRPPISRMSFARSVRCWGKIARPLRYIAPASRIS